MAPSSAALRMPLGIAPTSVIALGVFFLFFFRTNGTNFACVPRGGMVWSAVVLVLVFVRHGRLVVHAPTSCAIGALRCLSR